MDNGHVKRAFFKNIPNNWPIWAGELNKLLGIWVFQLNYQQTFYHCVSLVHDFPETGNV